MVERIGMHWGMWKWDQYVKHYFEARGAPRQNVGCVKNVHCVIFAL